MFVMCEWFVVGWNNINTASLSTHNSSLDNNNTSKNSINSNGDNNKNNNNNNASPPSNSSNNSKNNTNNNGENDNMELMSTLPSDQYVVEIDGRRKCALCDVEFTSAMCEMSHIQVTYHII